MLATVVFDLTVAIILGVVYSAILYMAKSSHIRINFSSIDTNKLRSVDGKPPILETSGVAYITGPLFFGAVDEFNHRMADMPNYDHVILSMRGMPSVDVSGAQAMLAAGGKCFSMSFIPRSPRPAGQGSPGRRSRSRTPRREAR